MFQLLSDSQSLLILTAFLSDSICCTDGVQVCYSNTLVIKKLREFSFLPLTVHDGFWSLELNLILAHE